MDIYYRAKERNPKTVTKHIVMLNFIDRTYKSRKDTSPFM